MYRHINQLKKINNQYKAPSGKNIEVIEIIVPEDENLISEWANHFRNQYCKDDELEKLIKGTGKSKSRFLEEIIFPDRTKPPGPSIRAGDFAEILLSDYLKYFYKFWIPRNRLQHKSVRNESIKGSDIVAFKFKIDGQTNSDDILAIFESKALLSGKNSNTLQNAINHSAKDYLRIAETLNAIKRRYLQRGDNIAAEKVARFQNLEDNPFQEIFGAVAFCTTNSFNNLDFFNVDESLHPKKEHLWLLVFHGVNLMPFVHKLYKKAIDES